jgi:hypothetical protein
VNPWTVDPYWQNFSSLYREAITAHEAKTDMERSHHLTASLYFGIAALEAFLNRKMRDRLKGVKSEEEIFDVLRKGKILSKIKKWPEEMLGKSVPLEPETLALLSDFNDIRGDLTHPKTLGRDIYVRMGNIEPTVVVHCVAEYIVKFHQVEGTRYPYWIFGWNYLNPRPNSYEIFLFNDQQFCFSLHALGFQVPAAADEEIEAWKDKYLRTFEGYIAIRKALSKFDSCEPKFDRFPFKPVLCRRWWLSEHQRRCGHVTDEAMEFARNYGG